MNTSQCLARLGAVAAIEGAVTFFVSSLLHPSASAPSDLPSALSLASSCGGWRLGWQEAAMPHDHGNACQLHRAGFVTITNTMITARTVSSTPRRVPRAASRWYSDEFGPPASSA